MKLKHNMLAEKKRKDTDVGSCGGATAFREELESKGGSFVSNLFDTASR